MAKTQPLTLRVTDEQLKMIQRQVALEKLSQAEVLRRSLDHGLPWGSKSLSERNDMLREAIMQEGMARTSRHQELTQIREKLKDLQPQTSIEASEITWSVRKADWLLVEVQKHFEQVQGISKLLVALQLLSPDHLRALRFHVELAASVSSGEVRKIHQDIADFLTRFGGL